MRVQRTGLLPWVLASNRALGQGCRIRGCGSHRPAVGAYRSQVIRDRWLRRRSERSHIAVTAWRNASSARLLSGTVGFEDGVAACCGAIKPLPDGACETKRMSVVEAARGQGMARALLGELERRARDLGYALARLDT
ncbi:MAG: GNAT family N-acetyltransferase, partial [Actinobacteria bacterium]|nr:GNAT family N-acetyltransferase [Actinomycetota bacterium]